MIAFQRIQKQKQQKREQVSSPKCIQTNSICLEASYYVYKNKQSIIDENTSFMNHKNNSVMLESQLSQLSQLAQKQQINQNMSINVGKKYENMEQLKLKNIKRAQMISQLMHLEQGNSNSCRKTQRELKQIQQKNILDLSINTIRDSRLTNRASTPLQRTAKYNNPSYFSSVSQEKQPKNNNNKFEKLSLCINNNKRTNVKDSESPPHKSDSDYLIHDYHHHHYNQIQNKDSLLFVRRIQTPNKFAKPQLLSPIGTSSHEQQQVQFSNEVIKRKNFMLANPECENIPSQSAKHLDKKQREQRQREIKDKIQSHFIESQLKFQSENYNLKLNNCSIRGLSLTPIHKNHSPRHDI